MIGRWLLWIAASAAASGTAAAADRPKGAVFHAPLDGSLTAWSARGSGFGRRDGIITFRDGVSGKAALLGDNGRTLSYRVANNLPLKRGSLEMFVKSTDWRGSEPQTRVLLQASKDLNWFALLKFSGDLLQFISRPYDRSAWRSAGHTIRSWGPDQWHHVGCTWTDGAIRLYFDGLLAGAARIEHPPAELGRDFYLGSPNKLWDGAPDAPDMLVDEVLIYDRPLPASEMYTRAHRFGDAVALHAETPVPPGLSRLAGPDLEAFKAQQLAHWNGHALGEERTVPPPFTPMAWDATGKAVKCWGRAYTFAGGVMPSQVASAGRDLLSGPMRLVAQSGGERRDIGDAAFTVAERADDRVRLTATGMLAGLAVKADWTCEFDGAAIVTLTLTPGASNAVDRLALEIPLHAVAARFYSGCETNWPMSAAGDVPDAGLVLGFRPVFWVGSEERGLTWFAEAPPAGELARPERTIAIVPGETATLVRITLIDARRTITRPLTLTFAVQATPTRPAPEHWRGLRTGGLIKPTERYRFHRDVYLADEWWRSGYAVVPRATDQLKAYMARLRGRPSKHVAVGFVTSPNLLAAYAGSREWPIYTAFGEAWMKRPIETVTRGAKIVGWLARQSDPDGAVSVCPNSAWARYYLHGINETVSATGMDAVLLEHTYLGRCASTAHGCQPASGDRPRTAVYPIFAARRLRQRLYRMLKARSPDFLIIDNASATPMSPLAAYADAVVLGDELGGRRYTDYVTAPFDVLRAQREAVGNPAAFLRPNFIGPARTSKPLAEGVFGVALAHDLKVWGTGADAATLAKLCKAAETFPLTEARCVPYYAARPAFTVNSDHVLITAFVHKREVLFVALNRGARYERVKVQPDLKMFPQFNSGFKATDVNPMKRIYAPEVVHKTVLVRVPPRSIRVIRVTPPR